MNSLNVTPSGCLLIKLRTKLAASASVGTSMLYAIVFASCHNHAPSATGTEWPELCQAVQACGYFAFVSTRSRQH
jgi:hypothetical protein